MCVLLSGKCFEVIIYLIFRESIVYRDYEYLTQNFCIKCTQKNDIPCGRHCSIFIELSNLEKGRHEDYNILRFKTLTNQNKKLFLIKERVK